MTPKILNKLLTVIEGACEMPLVPSHPLITLQDTLALLECEIEADDFDAFGDSPFEQLIEAAEAVAHGWIFYPPEVFGSSWALVDSAAVEALKDALEVYREATPALPLTGVSTPDGSGA